MTQGGVATRSLPWARNNLEEGLRPSDLGFYILMEAYRKSFSFVLTYYREIADNGGCLIAIHSHLK